MRKPLCDDLLGIGAHVAEPQTTRHRKGWYNLDRLRLLSPPRKGNRLKSFHDTEVIIFETPELPMKLRCEPGQEKLPFNAIGRIHADTPTIHQLLQRLIGEFRLQTSSTPAFEAIIDLEENPLSAREEDVTPDAHETAPPSVSLSRQPNPGVFDAQPKPELHGQKKGAEKNKRGRGCVPPKFRLRFLAQVQAVLESGWTPNLHPRTVFDALKANEDFVEDLRSYGGEMDWDKMRFALKKYIEGYGPKRNL
ncbi:hypothetical protein [Rhizobium binae]|uniref:hypothetical protein n=1 Tax=Rhizobium binae TaxID=1138190 RepID=UPI001C82B809|nr:hypothetical protein [Rhizobium binae]MBX4967868.1 hypothetical protein [Rhizobium binae]